MAHHNTNASAKESGGAPRALVWLVVGMGLALIGGSALLIGKIINKGSACRLEALALPIGAQVIGADGKQLQVLVSEEHGEMLQSYDLCSGALRREIAITR